MEETLTTETLPGTEQNVPASVGGESVESTSEPSVLEAHELINQWTGKNLPDPVAAEKAVKDTFKYVGEYGKLKPYIDKLKQSRGGEEAVLKFMEELTTQPAAPAVQPSTPAVEPAKVDESKFVSKEQYEEDMWFATHKELSDHKTVIRALRKETGKSFDEVLEHPELKPLIEAKSARQTDTTSRSVIHSNAQVADVSTDYSSDFAKAEKGEMSWADFAIKHKGLGVK